MFLDAPIESTINRMRARTNVPLRLELWNGRSFDFSPRPTVRISIPRRRALKYFVSPDLNKLGEAFVEGHINVEGPIGEVFRVAEGLARSAADVMRQGPRRFATHNRTSDQKAIEQHYDVSDEFYAQFLDRNMIYSCAYFRQESDTLEQAQEQKLDHILTKLMIRGGHRFLDIGCGWGALILRAAGKHGALATGVTLSRNQYDHVRNRIAEQGLQDRCSVELLDYRDIPGEGTYDRIASVGMFEHVGLRNLQAYFGKIRALLNDDGLVLNHGITTSDSESRWMGLGAGEFIDRYVFPQGELPHLSLVLKEMSLAGLEAVDVESLRRHYARTCDEWVQRLEANRKSAEAVAGARRFRIWQIYLAGCAFGFAQGWMNLYQILARKADCGCSNPLPLTRDYMYSEDTGGEAGRMHERERG